MDGDLEISAPYCTATNSLLTLLAGVQATTVGGCVTHRKRKVRTVGFPVAFAEAMLWARVQS